MDAERQWGLAELVEAAGQALQGEDEAFRADLNGNLACPGQRGGILRIPNERYFQFVIARSYAKMLPYIVKVEDFRRDVTLSDPNETQANLRHTVIEMKCWFSSSGTAELPGIKTDIFENLAADVAGTGPNGFRARNGFMFVFSANPVGKLASNVEWLSSKLGTNTSHWNVFSFETENANGSDVEFWVAGYDVENITSTDVYLDGGCLVAD